jgi:hypothetical protein
VVDKAFEVPGILDKFMNVFRSGATLAWRSFSAHAVCSLKIAWADNGLDAAQAAIDEGFGAKTMVLQLVCQYTWTPVRHQI